MKKKAQGVVEIIFASVVIVVTIMGVVSVLSEDNNIYYGNNTTKSYYDYSKCSSKLKQIDKKNLVVFRSDKEAEEQGYKYGNC